MTVAEAGEMGPDTRPRMKKVAPGVHAFVQLDGSWGLSNAGLIVSDDVVVLVDTCFTERRSRSLREAVLSVASIPPSILVNTHHHGDHVFGNGLFPEAIVISHEQTREAVLALDASASARRFTEVDFGQVSPTTATLTFADGLRLHAGDMVLDVFHPGLAHCVGNSVVHVRERGVLIAGDLLLKDCTPTFSHGSAIGYLEVLDTLRGLDVDVVVPGHGPVTDATVIDETERYVRFVLDLADNGRRTGRTPLQVAFSTDLGEFAQWLDHERLVGNLYRAYAEQAGNGAPARLDTAAMWRDTVEYLGRPLRSWA